MATGKTIANKQRRDNTWSCALEGSFEKLAKEAANDDNRCAV
jgi:hypothetical protein